MKATMTKLEKLSSTCRTTRHETPERTRNARRDSQYSLLHTGYLKVVKFKALVSCLLLRSLSSEMYRRRHGKNPVTKFPIRRR